MTLTTSAKASCKSGRRWSQIKKPGRAQATLDRVRNGRERFGERPRWYLYAAGSGRAVGYNFARTRDGDYARSGYTQDKGSFLGDASIGVAYRKGDMQTSFGVVYREIDAGKGLRGMNGLDTDVSEGLLALPVGQVELVGDEQNRRGGRGHRADGRHRVTKPTVVPLGLFALQHQPVQPQQQQGKGNQPGGQRCGKFAGHAGGGLADQAVAAALRYRSQAPLIKPLEVYVGELGARHKIALNDLPTRSWRTWPQGRLIWRDVFETRRPSIWIGLRYQCFLTEFITATNTLVLYRLKNLGHDDIVEIVGPAIGQITLERCEE